MGFLQQTKRTIFKCVCNFWIYNQNFRIKHNLKKPHRIDAQRILGNHRQKKAIVGTPSNKYANKTGNCTKQNLKKGIRRENRAPGYVYDYQLFDKVEYLDTECFVFGRRSSGYFDLRIIDGEVVNRSASVGKLNS